MEEKNKVNRKQNNSISHIKTGKVNSSFSLWFANQQYNNAILKPLKT